jgi:CubicO group peptidase (beta-lactamase class C family)
MRGSRATPSVGVPTCLLLLFGAFPLAAFPRELSVVRLDGKPIAASQIDATVTESMKRDRIPGVGIAIFNRGAIVYAKTYGERDQATHKPLTPDSIMTAASLTKAAFAVLVLQLVEKGVLDLDRPVVQYLPKPLPEYPLYRDLASDERFKQITLRMLLDHSSGFPNWRRFTDDHKLRIYFAPGSRFAYSGEGIALAQLVVESVTGKSIAELMREGIFRPLGMTRTSMVWEPSFESDYANAYDEGGMSLGPQRRRSGDAAGSMQTTLNDYARFVQAVLTGKLLDSRSTTAMLSAQIRIASVHEFPTLSPEITTANDSIHLSYGLGWGLYWTPIGEVFFKEGHDDGWRHYVVCFVKPKSGILIMTNSSNGEDAYADLLENLIRDIYTPYEWEGFKATAGVIAE